jgi:GNAT superfamily N-acetyltransferase
MAEEVVVQPYSEKYKDDIINMILDIQQKEFHVQIQKEDQPDLSDIQGFYQKGAGNFWIALYGDQLAGSISLLDIGDNQAALRKMFVKAPYRGNKYNVAKTLLQTSIEWAKQNKINMIYLGTTEKYLAAHRFYEKNRFAEISAQDLPASFPIMKVDTKFYKYVV